LHPNHKPWTLCMAWWWGGSGAKEQEAVASADSGSKCPVNIGSKGEAKAQAQGGAGGCPVPEHQRADHPILKAATQDAAGGCPVPEERRGDHPMIFLDPRNNMKVGGESQYPTLGQTKPLSRHRVESSIPKDEFTPAHQAETNSNKWVYPSEQMFYNAMKRKGWQPTEDDMVSVVAIHNAVNEKTWGAVLQWEQETHPECGEPKLVRFTGRPTDFSPRARMMGLMGYKMPFDRHDWVVDRCGRKVRYIIDFYNGSPTKDQPVSFHLDVRPALDDFESAYDRMRMAMKPWIGNLGSAGQAPSGTGAAK